MPQAADLDLGAAGGRSRPSSPDDAGGGFTMSGLSSDEHKAWAVRHYHACKPLEPFTKRIHQAAELQRPRRHIRRQVEDPMSPKFCWPMTATNFPVAWDR